jgi:hypothetical protein
MSPVQCVIGLYPAGIGTGRRLNTASVEVAGSGVGLAVGGGSVGMAEGEAAADDVLAAGPVEVGTADADCPELLQLARTKTNARNDGARVAITPAFSWAVATEGLRSAWLVPELSPAAA